MRPAGTKEQKLCQVSLLPCLDPCGRCLDCESVLTGPVVQRRAAELEPQMPTR